MRSASTVPILLVALTSASPSLRFCRVCTCRCVCSLAARSFVSLSIVVRYVYSEAFVWLFEDGAKRKAIEKGNREKREECPRSILISHFQEATDKKV